jgi:hypothetical protein
LAAGRSLQAAARRLGSADAQAVEAVLSSRPGVICVASRPFRPHIEL